MRKFIFAFLATATLSTLITTSNAASAALDCPPPHQIQILLVEHEALWLGPKVASSKDRGIGLGGLKAGPFKFAFPAPDGISWVCVYESPIHAPLTQTQNMTLRVPLSEILKSLPNIYEYGFLVYQR